MISAPPGSYWVVPEKLMAGPYPGSPHVGVARNRVAALLASGIRHFVNLMEPEEIGLLAGLVEDYVPIAWTVAAETRIELSCSNFPIRDFDTPSAELMSTILDEIDQAVAAGRCVYVHCRGGIGRTGTVVGCFLLRHRLVDADNVFDTIAWMRKSGRAGQGPSPETAAQRSFVKNWPLFDPCISTRKGR